MSERRLYWTCLAALCAVLPLTIAVHAWESLRPILFPSADIVVENGQTQGYSGGQWKLVDLRRLPGPSDSAHVILAEIETAPTDPLMLARSTCRVHLVDGEGRRFEPVPMTEPIVRQTHPDAAERPRCGALAFANAARGNVVQMAESFIVPAKARDLSLIIEFPGVSADTLVFKEKRS